MIGQYLVIKIDERKGDQAVTQYERCGKEGMGFGDFKLLAALGAWFGWMALPGIVLISSAIGAIVGITLIVLGRPRDDAIAFGPYLALAGFAYLLAGDFILSFYLPAGVF